MLNILNKKFKFLYILFLIFNSYVFSQYDPEMKEIYLRYFEEDPSEKWIIGVIKKWEEIDKNDKEKFLKFIEKTEKDIINIKDKYRNTPLHLAAKKGHQEIVEMLLAKEGVDPSARDRYGNTPLHFAAKKGHPEIVKMLLAKDADLSNAENFIKSTPLHFAAEKGHQEIVEILLARGADF
ncbi:hypothetical protein GF385_00640, partial [Candidatus Dependentiae bacterium]|nr:hypothetical protein [Candidatus Dependentiae bacterium]